MTNFDLDRRPESQRGGSLPRFLADLLQQATDLLTAKGRINPNDIVISDAEQVIPPTGDLNDPDYIATLNSVSISSDDTDPRISINDENPYLDDLLAEITVEEMEVMPSRLRVDNAQAAQQFFLILRSSAQTLLESVSPGLHVNYEQNQEWNVAHLVMLADRWDVPFVCLRIGTEIAGHYYLVLQGPELNPEGKYKVLCYDPLTDSEKKIDLPNWRESSLGPGIDSNLYEQGIYPNESGLNALRDGTYDYSMSDPESLHDLLVARLQKQDQVQFDSFNCGPACLFMAAVRAGFSKWATDFHMFGRSKLQDDTGLKVQLRDEIKEQ